MKVTIQELLNVLVGRDANEVVDIDANGIHVSPTTKVNLLGQPAKAQPERAQTQQIAPTKPRGPGRPRKLPGAPVSKQRNPATFRTAWKPEDLKTIADLRNKGASFEAIGKVFGRTAKAIQCQMQYMKNRAAATSIPGI